MKNEKKEKIFFDENKKMQFDFSNAINVFEPHNLANMYSEYLSDVDFVIENEDKIICLEYKNANVEKAGKPEAFQEKIKQDPFWKRIAKKFYGTMFLVWACDKNKLEKPIQYILVMESGPGMDKALKKRLIGKMQKHLPYAYQGEEEVKRHVIDEEFLLLSLEDWKNKYPQYPFCPVLSNSQD